MIPVWTTIFEIIFLKKRPGLERVLTLGLALGGLWIVFSKSNIVPLPQNAGELSKCTPVPACQWAAHLKGKEICKTWKQLDLAVDNPSTPQWNSPLGFFNIRMSQKGTNLFIRSIPYFKGSAGTSACFNSITGTITTGIFKTRDSYYSGEKRSVGINTNDDVPEVNC